MKRDVLLLSILLLTSFLCGAQDLSDQRPLRSHDTGIFAQLGSLISWDDTASIREAINILKTTGSPHDTLKFQKDLCILLLESRIKSRTPEEVKDLLLKFYDGRKINVGIRSMINQFYTFTFDSNNIATISIRYVFLDFYKQIGDHISFIAENQNIGFAFRTQGLHDKALFHFRAAYEHASQTNDTLGIMLNNHYIASTYRRIGDWDSTIARTDLGLVLGTKYNNTIAMRRAYYEAGFAHYSLGDYQKALEYQLESFRLKKLTEFTTETYAYHTAEIARCYLALHQLDSAKHYGLLTMEYVRNDDYTAAVTNSYLIMAEIYEALNHWRNAYAVYKQHFNVTTELVNTESTQELVAAQLTHDFEQIALLRAHEQKLKDELAKKDALAKTRLLWFMGLGTVGLIIGITFIVNRLRLTRKQKKIIEIEKGRSELLLLNILPREIAEELKVKGTVDATYFDEVTVMFTDFISFTQISERLSPTELVNEIHTCFKAYDTIIDKYNIEKIKTIGDSYMCAGGLPVANRTNAVDIVHAAIDIQQFMHQHVLQRKSEGKEAFEIRIGIHTGSVVAGIVGIKKFAYDIWGDTVNIASRLESGCEAGKINISGSTYELVKHVFNCTYRGKIEARHKGKIDMYFVDPR